MNQIMIILDQRVDQSMAGDNQNVTVQLLSAKISIKV